MAVHCFDEYSAQKDECYTWGLGNVTRGIEIGGIDEVQILEEAPLKMNLYLSIRNLPADWVGDVPDFVVAQCTFWNDGSLREGVGGPAYIKQ